MKLDDRITCWVFLDPISAILIPGATYLGYGCFSVCAEPNDTWLIRFMHSLQCLVQALVYLVCVAIV